MKLSTVLKKLGINVDDDIELDDAITQTKQQSEGNNDVAALVGLVNTLISQQSSPQTQQQVNQGNADLVKLAAMLSPLLKDNSQPKALYEEGFYNNETGEFDIGKITDEGLKNALSDFTSKQAAKDTQRIIDAAYNEELSKRSLAMDKELFRKVIDLSKVTVSDGKVTGMTEAFDALKDKGVYKAQPGSPLTQGFKPVENPNGNAMAATGGIGLYQAAAMEEENYN